MADEILNTLDGEQAVEGEIPPIVEPEPAPRDDWDDLVDKFLLIYPEFAPLLNTGNTEKDAQNKAFIKVIFEKIRCLYPEFSELALAGNVVQTDNGYSQAISAGTCGALVFKPSFIVRYKGI